MNSASRSAERVSGPARSTPQTCSGSEAARSSIARVTVAGSRQGMQRICRLSSRYSGGPAPGLADDADHLLHLHDPLRHRSLRVGPVMRGMAKLEGVDAFKDVGAAHQLGDEVGERLDSLHLLYHGMQLEIILQAGAGVGE